MADKRKDNWGRLTLPSEENFYEETLELIDKLGADALRDSDGTKLPDELKNLDGMLIYGKYFVNRRYNDFAKTVPLEWTRFYLSSENHTAYSDELEINILEEYYDQQIKADYDNDPKKWWEVVDRTTGEPIDVEDWEVDKDRDIVTIKATPFHDYTVSFLAYGIWDPVGMYNHIVNDWGDVPHDIPFDVRYEKSSEFVEEALRKYLEENPNTNVIRFTTFFYQFSLIFNKNAKQKYVDWFGYQNTVSPKALEAFEEEYGYRLRPEDFIDQGYYNSQGRFPSQRYLDYMDFQERFVSQKAKRLVDICHEYDRYAIMFLGDHWIGTEPYGKYFKDIGLDGVVGSVGDGVTLRLIADIDLPTKEGRFLPYFFPDVLHEGGEPTKEAMDNWTKARRALLKKPLDRIGYGGYLSLAYKFPDFIDYIEVVVNEYRDIYNRINDTKPRNVAKVAVVNAWGKIRGFGAWTVAHGLWYKNNYSYQGILEALSGMDVDVHFLTYEEVRDGVPEDIDVLINAGQAYTSYSGGEKWADEKLVSSIREFVYNGGGFIGIGEPSAYQNNGKFFQLRDVLGVDKEVGFSLGHDKYFVEPVKNHFILEDNHKDLDFGENIKDIYAIDEDTQILEYSNNEVHMAAKDYGKGRSFYMTGMPYSVENTRILKRAIHYVSHKEEELKKYFADDLRVEVTAYPEKGIYVVVNNSLDDVQTTVYDGDRKAFKVDLKASELKWFEG